MVIKIACGNNIADVYYCFTMGVPQDMQKFGKAKPDIDLQLLRKNCAGNRKPTPKSQHLFQMEHGVWSPPGVKHLSFQGDACSADPAPTLEERISSFLHFLGAHLLVIHATLEWNIQKIIHLPLCAIYSGFTH